MAIKPIETVYNGYRFRSRLEARWAVFFDTAYILYQYEPEGFDLRGEYYLPDFYLPDFEIYVEIKPFDKKVLKHVGDHNKWEQKCKLFRDITDRPILLCYGDPAEALWKILYAWEVDDDGGGYYEWYCLFVQELDGITLLTHPDRFDRKPCVNLQMEENPHIFCGSEECWNAWHQASIPPFNKGWLLDEAKLAARQARFEHGETPIRKEGMYETRKLNGCH